VSNLHHYVPQWYLKGFCDPRTPNGREPFLWVRSVCETIVKRRAPKNLAAENGYYDCTGPDRDKIEKELSAIESRAAFALRTYLHRPVGGRGSVPRDLSIFLAWLGARVPAFRRVFGDGWTDFLLAAKWGHDGLTPPAEYFVSLQHLKTGESRREPVATALPLLRSGAWTALPDQEQYAEFIRLQAWYFDTQHLPNLTWILLTAPTKHSFIVSDRPLVWFIPGQGYADSPAALRYPGVEVTVPLDREHVLLGLPIEAQPPTSVALWQINVRTACFAERFVAGASADAINEALDRLSRLPLAPIHP